MNRNLTQNAARSSNTLSSPTQQQAVINDEPASSKKTFGSGILSLFSGSKEKEKKSGEKEGLVSTGPVVPKAGEASTGTLSPALSKDNDKGDGKGGRGDDSKKKTSSVKENKGLLSKVGSFFGGSEKKKVRAKTVAASKKKKSHNPALSTGTLMPESLKSGSLVASRNDKNGKGGGKGGDKSKGGGSSSKKGSGDAHFSTISPVTPNLESKTTTEPTLGDPKTTTADTTQTKDGGGAYFTKELTWRVTPGRPLVVRSPDGTPYIVTIIAAEKTPVSATSTKDVVVLEGERTMTATEDRSVTAKGEGGTPITIKNPGDNVLTIRNMDPNNAPVTVRVTPLHGFDPNARVAMMVSDVTPSSPVQVCVGKPENFPEMASLRNLGLNDEAIRRDNLITAAGVGVSLLCLLGGAFAALNASGALAPVTAKLSSLCQSLHLPAFSHASSSTAPSPSYPKRLI